MYAQAVQSVRPVESTGARPLAHNAHDVQLGYGPSGYER
jgi:hypothetical protein